MSELLSAVAATLGAPEELIQRSAEARAAAQGVDAEQVLQAWAGGNVPVPSAAKVPDPAPEPAPVVEAVAVEIEVEPADPVPAEKLPAVAVATIEPPIETIPQVEPAPLARRILLPAALGAAAGAFLGIMTAAVAAVFFVDNVTTVEDETVFRAAIEVEILPIVIGMGLLSTVFGAFLGVLGRKGPGFFQSKMTVLGGPGIVPGALIGLIMGAVGGGVLTGVLGMETINEGLVAVPIGSALWWLVLGGAVLGADTALLCHVTAVPAGLTAADHADSGEVRTRLSQSVAVPLVSLLVLVVVIAIIATLFLVFHEAAATLAIVISAGILLFAFLGGYQPSIKLRYTEVVAALAGIATVVVAIVMVVVVRGH
jgi:hypothetical protein